MQNENISYTKSLAMLMLLFLLCGFGTVLNSILIPYLQTTLRLSYSTLTLIPISFYLAYFIVSPLYGQWCRERPHLTGIKIGLITAMAGTALIALSDGTQPSLAMILIALFILGSGIAMVQVSGNPYVVQLGDIEKAGSRMALVHASTSVGMIAAPFIGSYILLGALEEQISGVFPLFTIYGLLFVSWAFLVFWITYSKFPSARSHTNDAGESYDKALKDPYVIYGVLAIATSVGIEVSCSSFMIPFLSSEEILGMKLEKSGLISTAFWILFTLGRVVSSLLLRRIREETLLTTFALLGVGLGVITVTSSGTLGAASAIALGLSTSALFPVIFTITLSRTKANPSVVSGLLCMANIGGALFPMLQGIIADNAGVHFSYLVPMAGFVFIKYYASVVTRMRRNALVHGSIFITLPQSHRDTEKGRYS